LKGLISDLDTIKGTIQAGSKKIRELEDTAKEAKSKPPATPLSRDPPTPYDQGFFDYENADSVKMNDLVNTQPSLDSVTTSKTSPPRHNHPPTMNEPTPNRPYPPQQMPPLPPADPNTYQQQQTRQQMYLQQEQQQHPPPDPPVEAMQRLQEYKYQSEQANRNATSAQDHARALAIQYEDLRAQAGRAEIVLNEKKPKKKGFFGGGKREAVSWQSFVQNVK
jgi:hypothetical protein